jgi:hypothetical protein
MAEAAAAAAAAAAAWLNYCSEQHNQWSSIVEATETQ